MEVSLREAVVHAGLGTRSYFLNVKFYELNSLIGTAVIEASP